jgi:hypothetical protein
MQSSQMDTGGIDPGGGGKHALGTFRWLLTGHENPNLASEVEYPVTHQGDHAGFAVYGFRRKTCGNSQDS